MRRLMVVVLVALVGAAEARAEVVARDGRYVLEAESLGRALCLDVDDIPAGEGCGPLRLRSPFDPTFLPPLERGRFPLALAVTPEAVTAEVGGRRLPTVAAQGFQPRFLLVAKARPDALVRFFDASGRLIGAARNDDPVLARSGGPDVLARRAGVRVTARRDFALIPDPLDLDRTVKTSCLRFTEAGGGLNCRPDRGAPLALDLGYERNCAPERAALTGTTSPEVRRLSLTLGSGRELRIPTLGVPAPYAGHLRLVASRLPRGEAVRSVRGLDAAGRVVARRRPGYAPGGLPCGERGAGGSAESIGVDAFGFRRGPARGRPVATVGRERLRASDGPRRSLCVGFAARNPCGPAPVDSQTVYLYRSGDAIGGVVAGDVATVAFRVADGEPIRVRTIGGSSYDGRFSGRVRFVAARVPRRANVVRAVTFDDAGHRLGVGLVDGLSEPPGASERMSVAPGLNVVALPFDRRTLPCLVPTGLPIDALFPFCLFGLFGDPQAVASTCSPRRLIVYGYLEQRVRSVALALDDGSELRADVTRLPRRLGRGRVWTATPPPGIGVLAVVYSSPPRDNLGGRLPTRQRYVLPSAREQCGYVID